MINCMGITVEHAEEYYDKLILHAKEGMYTYNYASGRLQKLE